LCRRRRHHHHHHHHRRYCKIELIIANAWSKNQTIFFFLV
jgi:hypothetical protein